MTPPSISFLKTFTKMVLGYSKYFNAEINLNSSIKFIHFIKKIEFSSYVASNGILKLRLLSF